MDTHILLMVPLDFLSLQLRTIDALHRAIALYPIVSWRIAMLMRFGRTCPELPADLFCDQDE